MGENSSLHLIRRDWARDMGLGVISKDLIMEAGHKKAWRMTMFWEWMETQEPAEHHGKTGEGNPGNRELKKPEIMTGNC